MAFLYPAIELCQLLNSKSSFLQKQAGVLQLQPLTPLRIVIKYALKQYINGIVVPPPFRAEFT